MIYESELPAVEKSVLLAYADFDRREKGAVIYPSYAYIAWLTGWKLTTVKDAVYRLCDRHLLEPCGYVPTSQPRGRVVRYRINIAQLPLRPAWRPDDSSRVAAPVSTNQSFYSASPQSTPDSSTEAGSPTTEAGSPIDSSRVAAADLYVRDQSSDRTDERPGGPRVTTKPAKTGTAAGRVDPIPNKYANVGGRGR